MEYKDFQSTDFVQDTAFIRWVKYGENDEIFRDLLAQFPYKKSIIEEAANFVKLLRDAESKQDLSNSESAVWSEISNNLNEQETEPKTGIFELIYTAKWLRVAVAAGIVLVFGILTKDFWKGRAKDATISYVELIETAQKQTKLIEEVNNTSKPVEVHLTDGSVVTLQPNAKLSYPQVFNENNRQVFLSGEAFFEITKNPKKPFFAYANEVITKVLGTSFSIKAMDDDANVVVSVKTGRVSVFHQNKIDLVDPEEKGLIISSNQQIVFSRKDELLVKSLVSTPMIIQDLSLFQEKSFEERPAVEVLKAIELAYGINIIYDAEQLANCIITTTLADDSLYDQLNVLCRTIDASYKVVDAQIVIQSSGCI